MTDAALADSGPAPEAPVGAAINENAPAPSSPLGSQIPPDARAENQPKPEPRSITDSIDRAFERSAKDQAEKAAAKAEPKTEAKAPEPKPEAKEPLARGEGGKFAPKDPAPAAAKPAEPVKPSHTAEDAPARFTDTAKAKWHATDPEIRGETLRMHKELTEGFQKYKAAAERDGALNEFHEMAKASGKELPNVVREYVNMENKLRHDLVGGLEDICQRVGVSLRDVAAHVLNQTPDQQASAQDTTIRELRQELAGLKQQLGGVTQTIEQQREQHSLTEVQNFRAAHPRFDELADAIVEEMKHGYDLPTAYSRAERLNPATTAPAKEEEPAASSAAVQDPPPVQPDKGEKSINGAPSSGSSPGGKKRAAIPLDQALENAFRRVG